MEHHGREMSCPHGNTARRKCSHCDAEDSDRALAAADRLAEAVSVLTMTDEPNRETCAAVMAALLDYLAERGR